jgi:hypothetical protein
MTWRRAAYGTFVIASLAVVVYAAMAALARPRAHDAHFYWGFRVTVCVWALTAAAFLWVRFRNVVFLAFLGVAVLFNPLRPFFLSKATWSVIDLGVAVLSGWVVLLSWQEVRKQ